MTATQNNIRKKMKRVLGILFVASLILGCENQEFEYPDFDYTSVYFPIQYPVRTLTLGGDRIDNVSGNDLKFQIGVAIGGLYKNTKEWSVDFTMDTGLMDTLVNQNGDTLRLLPQEYYSLNPGSQIKILPGTYSGFTEVQLTEAFLDDTLATYSNYVIPLRITSTTADSILTGRSLVDDPNIHAKDNWDLLAPPKHFVLFGVKYINKYHGYYLHRGAIVVKNGGGQPIDTIVFRNRYIVDDQVVRLATAGKNMAVANFLGQTTSSNNYLMKFSFNEEGNIAIQPASPSVIGLTGTGTYIEEGDTWGGMKHKTMYLSYSYTSGANTHEVTDTIVFRNNGIALEENSITLLK
jgi:hypothetical protein